MLLAVGLYYCCPATFRYVLMYVKASVLASTFFHGISPTPGNEVVETICTTRRVEDACICSSLHVQGTFTYTDSHRCPLHNDTLEHDCTSKNIVPGLIVSSDGGLETPCAVEDWCICSSLHIHGNLVNVRYYHRCPVHNDTMEHDCTHFNTVTGQSNLVKFGETPETISMPKPVEDACICSTLQIQGNSAYKYQYRCLVHNDTEEHNCMRSNVVIGR